MSEPWEYLPPEVNWVGPECSVCGGDEFEVVVYGRSHPEYDRRGSEHQCVSCGARTGRWSKRLLLGQDCERRYGHQLANEGASE